MTKTEQLADFHKGNIEAALQSSQIWVRGLKDLSRHVAAEAQSTMEDSVSTIRALGGMTSLRQMFELQSSFARTAMEKALTRGTALTETSLKLAEQATAPITARVDAAVTVFSRAQ